MALKDIVKGICGTSRCKYDVYTKEKVDELLETKPNTKNVYVKGDYWVIEGTLKDYVGANPVFSEAVNQVAMSFSYPEGFNANNTIVVSKVFNDILSFSPGHYYTEKFEYNNDTGVITSFSNIDCVFQADEISVYIKHSPSIKDWSDYGYKLVLLKYKD